MGTTPRTDSAAHALSSSSSCRRCPALPFQHRPGTLVSRPGSARRTILAQGRFRSMKQGGSTRKGSGSGESRGALLASAHTRTNTHRHRVLVPEEELRKCREGDLKKRMAPPPRPDAPRPGSVNFFPEDCRKT